MEKKQKIHKVFLNAIKFHEHAMFHEHRIYSMFIIFSKNQKKTNEKPSSPPGEELHHFVGESVIVQ